MSLLGSPAIPFDCLRLIRRDSVPHLITQAETALGGGMPLLGGPEIPFGRFDRIGGNVASLIIAHPELILRLGVALLRQPPAAIQDALRTGRLPGDGLRA